MQDTNSDATPATAAPCCATWSRPFFSRTGWRRPITKAKAARPHVEKLITLGKRGDLHSRRQALSYLMTREAVTRLFDTVAPRYGDRNGGYLRIVRTGFQKRRWRGKGLHRTPRRRAASRREAAEARRSSRQAPRRDGRSYEQGQSPGRRQRSQRLVFFHRSQRFPRINERPHLNPGCGLFSLALVFMRPSQHPAHPTKSALYEMEAQMKVVLYGATGMIGSRILGGASCTRTQRHRRGQEYSESPRPRRACSPCMGTCLTLEVSPSTARGADAAISAFSPGVEAPGDQTLTTAFQIPGEGL